MSYPHPEQTPMGWEPPTGTPSQPNPGWAPYQGGPVPPHGGYPGPPVAPPKRRRWPWILLGIFVLLLLLIGGCSWLVFRAFSPTIDAANEWIVLVDEQRFDEAYDQLCQSTKNAQSSEEVVAILANDFGPSVDGYQINQYQNTNGVVQVGGSVTLGGDERPITFGMVNEDDTWRVCSYSFSVLDVGP